MRAGSGVKSPSPKGVGGRPALACVAPKNAEKRCCRHTVSKESDRFALRARGAVVIIPPPSVQAEVEFPTRRNNSDRSTSEPDCSFSFREATIPFGSFRMSYPHRKHARWSIVATIVSLAACCAVADGADNPRRSTLRIVPSKTNAVRRDSAVRPASAEEPLAERSAAADDLTFDPFDPKFVASRGVQPTEFEAPPPQVPSLEVDTLPPPTAALAPNPYETTSPGGSTSGAAPPSVGLAPDESMSFEQQRPPRALAEYLRNRPRQPQLQRESWLNRPYSLGFFLGGMFLSDPVAGVNGQAGILYGGRFGWDFDPRCGLELRFVGANPAVADARGLVQLSDAQIFSYDLQWLFYPTGDTRWRPYFGVGVGLFDMDFRTPTGGRYHNTTFLLPWGVGLKYRYSPRIAMRLDLTDNVSFASGSQNAMNNFSISAGLEAHFGGGSRRNYWPWNPGRDWR